ncbi:hypothetical protein [Streptomyces sp. NBC_01408]|uniref:hypothetical protein n=1 Tax=Streptomyces sp. NBC_01408 TaxID=2903855 RepID=UPI002252B345|nr:hypothetical protein [Streptomyces sp. NBC_01408]MCX4690828.1 hypothetical protein [Streptomyces sp. NBC_01408]
MSRRTDNRHRVATICREATGLAHHTCLRWAEQGLITRGRPVPDAADPAQRAFEAMVALTAGDALRDGQLDGAVFGVVAAVPSAGGLALRLHERMARWVVTELLPRLDEGYGGLRGVPGLRVTADREGLALRDAAGGGTIRLQGVPGSWRLPDDGDGLRYVGRIAGRAPHAAEHEELHRWRGTAMAGPDPASRDHLLSRLLRRPALINRTGNAHGWVNSYCHQYQDLVLEWCCAPGAPAMEQSLRRSGLAAPPEGAPPEPGAPAVRPGVIRLGRAEVTVRCMDFAHTGGEIAEITASVERRYE